MNNQDFESAFAQARKEREEYVGGGLEPGRYTVVLSEVFKNISQGGQGNPQVVFVWKVVDGEAEGATHKQYQSLAHPTSISIIENFLTRCGFDTDGMTMSRLEKEIIPQLNDLQVQCVIRIVQNGEYRNVKIAEILGATAEDENTQADEPEEEPEEEQEESPEEDEEEDEEIPEDVPEEPKTKKKSSSKKTTKTPAKKKEKDEVETEVGIGTVVIFVHNNKEFEGEIIGYDEDNGSFKIQAGAKVFDNVTADQIEKVI